MWSFLIQEAFFMPLSTKTTGNRLLQINFIDYCCVLSKFPKYVLFRTVDEIRMKSRTRVTISSLPTAFPLLTSLALTAVSVLELDLD